MIAKILTVSAKLNQDAQRYTTYLHLLDVSHRQISSPQLAIGDECMLNQLALAWRTGEDITVLEVMTQAQGMSITTAHRRLKSLCKQGFITLVTNEDDNRVKHVVASDLATEHFARMGLCLIQALN